MEHTPLCTPPGTRPYRCMMSRSEGRQLPSRSLGLHAYKPRQAGGGTRAAPCVTRPDPPVLPYPATSQRPLPQRASPASTLETPISRTRHRLDPHMLHALGIEAEETPLSAQGPSCRVRLSTSQG